NDRIEEKSCRCGKVILRFFHAFCQSDLAQFTGFSACSGSPPATFIFAPQCDPARRGFPLTLIIQQLIFIYLH
ncbi:MAG: hypothetical protein ACLVG4_15115, partial [Blautia faecis]